MRLACAPIRRHRHSRKNQPASTTHPGRQLREIIRAPPTKCSPRSSKRHGFSKSRRSAPHSRRNWQPLNVAISRSMRCVIPTSHYSVRIRTWLPAPHRTTPISCSRARNQTSNLPRMRKLTLGAGARLNALGAYAWYHLRAMTQATRIAHGDLTPEERAQAARAVLADEAFATHFLEDAFAAGHVAGNWGNQAVRLGTHDYYNEYGIEAVTWRGKHYIALGDGNMGSEDKERAAAAVRDSLVQVLEALEGKAPEGLVLPSDDKQPETFNICSESHFPTAVGTTAALEVLVVPIVVQTPVPALATGKGELPRFRGEIGAFLGASGAASAEGLDGGFGTNQTSYSAVGSLELAVRAGFGLEGVMSEAGDGLVFAELGLRYDSHSTSSTCGSSCNLAATMPARSAVTLRLRCPFWLIPGDLIVAGPVLVFTSPKTLTKMAVEAANGGLIPYEAGIATQIGRFQFVLGREVGISFYGNNSFIMPTPGVPPNNATVAVAELDTVRVSHRRVPAVSLVFDGPELERADTVLLRHRSDERHRYGGHTRRCAGT